MSWRVLSVFGTRPEAIKMAPVVRRLADDARFDSLVCVTGQHKELLSEVLELFAIEPDHDLAIMRPGQDLYDVTSRVLVGMRAVLRVELPDVVLVHGDTTSCFAASLAAFYERIPVAHVEAGLRTGDYAQPYPEEMNRVLVGRIASTHFAPTERARANLLAEGVDPTSVHVTGNTVIDALLDVRARVAGREAASFAAALGAPLVERLAAGAGPLVLVTGHRRESFGKGFRDLGVALRRAAERHPERTLVYPVHPNPNVLGTIHAALDGLANAFAIEPLDYATFVWLMDRADAIVTDSGGIQEEAPSLGKPVLVTRTVTERPEAVEAGTVRLVGTDPERITAALDEILGDAAARAWIAATANPYGDGLAGERIAGILARGDFALAGAASLVGAA